MELAHDDTEKLDDWHRSELRRLRFTRTQERFLRSLIDAGEVELAEIREKVEVRGWEPEQVMACYAA